MVDRHIAGTILIRFDHLAGEAKKLLEYDSFWSIT